MKIYISHGAGNGPDHPDDCDWFIVEPRSHPDDQVKSLLKARRTVYELNAVPYNGQAGPREIAEADLAMTEHIHDDDGTVEGCPGCFDDRPRTKTTHHEFRIWRRTRRGDRRWTTVRTREGADEVVTEMRRMRQGLPIGVEHVFVIEESDGIEWQEE